MQVERPRERGAFCVGGGCGGGSLRASGSRGRAFCAGERFAGCRLASSDITLRFATSPDNLQRFLEVAAKKNASACKTSAASPSTSRNYRSRARLASKTTQSRAHPGRTAHTRAFFGSRSAKPLSNSSSSHQPKSNPLANSSAAHRLNPDPLASTSPVHRPEPTLLPTTPQTVRPKPATLRVVTQPTALRIISPSQAPDQRLPAHRPKPAPLPATLQAIGPIPSPHQHSPEPSTRCGRTARRSSLLRLRHSLALGRTDRPRALAAMRATSSIFDSLIICWLQTVTTLTP